MINIIDIVKGLLESVDDIISVNKVIDLGSNTYELITCDYKHANKCNYLININNDVNYKILSYSDNGLIVTSLSIPEIGDYKISDVSFIHGTYINANTAMLMMDENGINFDNVAFFVSSPLTEKISYKSSKTISSVISVQLLLLAKNDPYNWCPSDHYTYAINPMRNYSELIMNAIDKNVGDFNKPNDIDLVSMIDVGIYKDKSGAEKELFSYKFSGVMMNFDLGVKNNAKCCFN